MAGFLKILAASVGGGLVLGAGIRMGEAMGSAKGTARSRAVDLVERDDLKREIGEDLDRRLAAVEEKLHLRMKAAARETANAMAASIEMRVTPRISRLETEVGGQSAALAELRDCSLQSERSIQRLITVLERTMGPKEEDNVGSGLKRPA